MGNIINCILPKKEESKEVEAQQKPQVSQQDMTILKLKTAQDRLLAQKKAIQKNSDKALEEAKGYAAQKNKERAKFCLKRKKLYDTYLTDTEN